jgi:hypothetical protein
LLSIGNLRTPPYLAGNTAHVGDRRLASRGTGDGADLDHALPMPGVVGTRFSRESDHRPITTEERA